MGESATGLKRFYLVLGVIAAVGALAIVLVTMRGPSAPVASTTSGPIFLATDSDFRGYFKGSPDAPVEITEFSDFECPFCARFWVVQFPDVERRLIATGRVRWRFRDYPLDGHLHSRTAAMAAQCAGEQGQFWPMHDSLFVNQREWATRRRGVERIFKGFAGSLGLDRSQFDACLDTGRFNDRLNAGLNEGRKLPVTGTPTFTVNGVRLPNVPSADELVRIVDSIAPIDTP